MKSYVKLVLMAGFVVLFLNTVIAAQMPGAHPDYLSALSDLRDARANILETPSSPEVNAMARSAIGEIDAAIRDLHDAAKADGLPLRADAPIDVPENGNVRMYRAMDLLKGARRDVDQPEQNPAANTWRGNAIGHIDEALRILHRI